MSFIVWSESLNIGFLKIDEQHRLLAGVINSLYDANTARERERAIERALYTLVSYVKFHFKTEEDLMADIGYPDRAAHIEEHEQLTGRVRDLQNESSGSGYGIHYGDFTRFLRDWFMNHTQGTDRKLAPALLETIESGAPLKTAPPVLIRWRDEYDIGIGHIDKQHRRLVDIINDVYASISDPALAERAIKDLQAYTDYHFGLEEELQRKAFYPLADDHKLAHRQFRLTITDLAVKFRKHKTVVDFDLVTMLKDWFMKHTQNEDRDYVPFLTDSTLD